MFCVSKYSSYVCYATYGLVSSGSTIISGFGFLGCLDSPHLLQLSPQSSRYASSFSITASAALLHSSLGSSHPASLHSFEMNSQQFLASSLSNAALLRRTKTHSSLASTHVLSCLNWSSARSRIFCLVNSKVILHTFYLPMYSDS